MTNQFDDFPIMTVPHLVIYVAVGEHGVEVFHTFTCTGVVVVLQSFLDGSQVHGSCYDLMIILIRGKNQCVRLMLSCFLS